MDKDALRSLLEQVKLGEVQVGEALEKLKLLPYNDLGFAKIDCHRHLRQGFPEVVFGQGKTPEQIAKIMEKLSQGEKNILATRISPQVYEKVKEVLPEVIYYPLAKVLVANREKAPQGQGEILVITAGTSDIPVAEEAAITAEIMGSRVERLYDVGVAGIHRLLDQQEKMSKANVLIVVAGMEGALASVVGGLVDKPVIAVPTSIGYGASFHGLAALLSMLNSCASGVTVVNIDNGFGAGYTATLINRLAEKGV